MRPVSAICRKPGRKPPLKRALEIRSKGTVTIHHSVGSRAAGNSPEVPRAAGLASTAFFLPFVLIMIAAMTLSGCGGGLSTGAPLPQSSVSHDFCRASRDHDHGWFHRATTAGRERSERQCHAGDNFHFFQLQRRCECKPDRRGQRHCGRHSHHRRQCRREKYIVNDHGYSAPSRS